jgi:hypothetical protein
VLEVLLQKARYPKISIFQQNHLLLQMLFTEEQASVTIQAIPLAWQF